VSSMTRLFTQDAPEISEAPEEGQQGSVLHEAADEAAAEVPTELLSLPQQNCFCFLNQIPTYCCLAVKCCQLNFSTRCLLSVTQLYPQDASVAGSAPEHVDYWNQVQIANLS
jgi:hypothetical protein